MIVSLKSTIAFFKDEKNKICVAFGFNFDINVYYFSNFICLYLDGKPMKIEIHNIFYLLIFALFYNWKLAYKAMFIFIDKNDSLIKL